MSNWKLKSEEEHEKAFTALSESTPVNIAPLDDATKCGELWRLRALSAESIATSALDMLEKVKTQQEQLLMTLAERYPDVIMQYIPDYVILDEATSLLNQNR